MNRDGKGYYDFDDAVAADNVVKVANDNKYVNALLEIDTATLENGDIEVVRFTDGNPTEEGFEDATATTVKVEGGFSGAIKIDDLEANTIVVVRLNSREDTGDYVYFAFQVTNPS